jgi:peptide/nickel transport system permease protein
MLLAISLLVFAAIRATPGDPVLQMLTERNQAVTPDTVSALRGELGLNAALPIQYVDWVTRLVQGDWGTSWRTRQPVRDEMARRLPWSLAIGGGGLALAASLSLPLGWLAATRPGGAIDALSRFGVVASQALPAFVVALLLAWLASAQLGLLKVYSGGMAERIVLPLCLVALYALPALMRVTRQAFAQAQQAPWMLSALARGMHPDLALARYGGKQALIALIAVITPQCAWMLGGTAVAEIVFAIPGLSQWLVESVSSRDYPVLQVFVLGVALLMLSLHALAQVLHAQLDPRPAA